MSLAAAVLTTIALVLLRPPQQWLVRYRLGGQGAAVDWRHRSRRLPTLLAGGALIAVVSLGASPAYVLAGSTAVGVGWFWWRLRRAAREAAVRRSRSAQVAEIVDALGAELGAGILPQQAIEGLAQDLHLLGGAAAASRMGGDVAGALRTAARAPGAESLTDLAAAWDVSERAGAPMARVLDRLGDSLRDERDVQREILAGLGPAKATARLMAVLPLFGLGLGMSMGADPLSVLLGSVPGSLCLATGTALACAGVWWVDRIAVRAERA